MKKLFYMGMISLSVLLLYNCSKNDENISSTSTNGNLDLKFENGFLDDNNVGGQLILNQSTFATKGGQKTNYSTVKYIISNIVLIKADGTEIKYNYNNPDKGAFIIDQGKAIGGVNSISLTDVPIDDYKKIRFGLGISKASHALGAEGQGSFLAKAMGSGMWWSWAAGYIGVKLEGKFGTSSPETDFTFHIGKKMNSETDLDPYREITLDLPVSAKVRTNITPSIHLTVNLFKHLSGDTNITLDNSNRVNMSGSGIAQTIIGNLVSNAFKVDHVHNDVSY